MSTAEPSSTVATSQRMLSLDIFRGLTIAGMIIVNDPGSWDQVYDPFLHAHWNGITPTDLVFPFFLFIVGVSIALSYTKQVAQGKSRREMTIKILRRSAIIFGLGVFLNLFPQFNFAEVRIPGVLQRIALVFLACALLFLYVDYKNIVRIGIGFLVGYWLIMCFVPTPGYGQVMLEPGKNVAAWIDSLIIPGKMWQGTWDPEGVLSTFPSIVTGICGIVAGKVLLSPVSQEQKLVRLLTGGFIVFTIGAAWHWIFPINKNLWTSSYTLYTAGLATMSLATLIWAVDVKGWNKWAQPAMVFGTNAIAAYVLHGTLIHLFFIPESGNNINSLFMGGLTGIGLAPKFASLLWALAYCAVCYGIVLILYKRKIFIKI